MQSIFLLLASGAFFSEFAFPFASSEEAGSGFLSDKVFNIQDHPVLLVLTVLGGLISFGAIFLYKNRGLQSRLSLMTIVMSILLPLVAFLLMYTEPDEKASMATYNDGVGLYLPVAALIFGILANKFIKKDDKLVKSMDRLR